MNWRVLLPAIIWGMWAPLATAGPPDAATTRPAEKTASAFYPPRLIAAARANAAKYLWAARIRDRLVTAAKPWMEFSDDQLWSLMFGNTIKRSWMVWSNGYCPACRRAVPMYNWKIDALTHPWKVQCPHCREFFPKNDFAGFHRSGLNAGGVFEPARADRSLLFNAEHPDPKDPLHKFGVDDGEGFVQDGHRWRFIGAYLIYGQWKQAIVAGIRNLSGAYVVTGDPVYAHKAAILLDRVADLHPSFDFRREGILYESVLGDGYVSVWHDACYEIRDLTLGYDQIFDAIGSDTQLAAFLSAKAREHGLKQPKATAADIRRNIETGILRDVLAHRGKIESNYPQTDMTLLMIKTVLGWPANREEVLAQMDPMVERATAVDGLSGEKGLDAYAAISPRSISELFARYARIEPSFLGEMLRRHPRLHAMFRFHIDTWCLERFYPRSGDTSNFAEPTRRYVGMDFTQEPGTGPSSYQFLWDLYELLEDADFVRILDRAAGGAAEGLPYDVFAAEPAAFQQKFQTTLAKAGRELTLPSVNKPQWSLGILRSGRGESARAAWLDYDSGGAHGHFDGMTLGLFAYGLDLLPDFGYPPVNYGGWDSPRALWYRMSAAHNTVVVDGRNTALGSGRTTLWADGQELRALRASAPAMIGGKQYERTVAMVETGQGACYLVDIFRVIGGSEHTKFVHGPFGPIRSTGLNPAPAADFGRGALIRNLRADRAPQQAWSVDWNVEDRLHVLAEPREVHLKYTDLTASAEAFLAESWISASGFRSDAECWLPTVGVRRTGPAPLQSTFVSLLEPYETKSAVVRVRRIPVESPRSGDVAIEVTLASGDRDLILAADVEQAAATQSSCQLLLKDLQINASGDLFWLRLSREGTPLRVGAYHGRSLAFGPLSLQLAPKAQYVEIAFGKSARVEAGSRQDIEHLKLAGESLLPATGPAQ